MNHLFSIKRFLKWCVLGMVSLIVCVGGVCILIGKNIARYHQIVEIHRKNLNADFDDLHKYQGHVFVTNVNSPTVGFFMQEAGYGVCSPDVISQEGIINAAECKIAFFKMSPKRPEYFVLFDDPQFFPGFSNWIPSSPEGREGLKLLKLRLASHFPLVHKNRIFEVYDLHKNVE